MVDDISTKPVDSSVFAEPDRSSVVACIALLRETISRAHPGPSREKSLALTKIDEAEMWLQKVP